MLLEICCESIDDALEAEAGGADRVELCANLAVGGLTPSAEAISEIRRLRVPAVVMIRARSGDFHYTDDEFATMATGAEAAVSHDVAGLVFGVLTTSGAVDTARTQRLRDIAGARDAVFHRAFDVTPDPFRALDELVDLGMTRVLTSGRQATALEGVELLKRLVDYAGDRIQIMPGGGIRPVNVEAIVSRTGCRQVHSGATAKSTVEELSRLLKTRA